MDGPFNGDDDIDGEDLIGKRDPPAALMAWLTASAAFAQCQNQGAFTYDVRFLGRQVGQTLF